MRPRHLRGSVHKFVSSGSESGRSALAGLVPRYLGDSESLQGQARCMEAFQGLFWLEGV